MLTAEDGVSLAAALPFADTEELGDAWHAVGGYDRVWTSNEMDALLISNPLFATRSAASAEALFFGPTRELLRTKALTHRKVSHLGAWSKRACKRTWWCRLSAGSDILYFSC